MTSMPAKKMVFGIPVWLLQLWLVTTVLMGAWAYFAFPQSEFKFTLLNSAFFLVVIVVLGALGKFKKK